MAASIANAQVVPARPSETIQAQLEAYNRGDVEGFMAFYAEDAEVHILGSDAKPVMAGRAEIEARYGPLLQQVHPQAQVLTRIEDGRFVIDHERTTARGQSKDATVIYEVENGKIRKVWFLP
jgi:hypothetical protein